MTNTNRSDTDAGQPAVYEIQIKGHLSPQWSDWFEGMAIRQEANGETTITGPVIDQAALHGILRKVRDLGLPLVSVIPIQPDTPDA